MNNQELDEMINWCRNKIKEEKHKVYGFRLTSKELEGYKTAMLQVMSYLHSKKEN